MIGGERLIIVYVIGGIFASICQLISEYRRNETRIQMLV